MILLEIGHVLCTDDDIDDLDKLGGLNTDTGETDPCLVAGTVVLTEDNQGHQQRNDHRPQKLPLLTQKVRVNDGKDHKGEKADDDGKKMLEANIRSAEEEIEGLKPTEYSWTAEELAEYRELAGQIVVMKNRYFLATDGEEAEEMQRLISRYVDGQMNADQLLSALDQKLRMMQMEEGD